MIREQRIDGFRGAAYDMNPVALPPGFASLCRNVYGTTDGAMSKRPGFEREVHNQYSGAVTGLAKTDDVFIVIGANINDA